MPNGLGSPPAINPQDPNAVVLQYLVNVASHLYASMGEVKAQLVAGALWMEHAAPQLTALADLPERVVALEDIQSEEIIRKEERRVVAAESEERIERWKKRLELVGVALTVLVTGIGLGAFLF